MNALTRNLWTGVLRLSSVPTALSVECRSFHTSQPNCSKRNFRKFLIGPHRGTAKFRYLCRNRRLFKKKYPDIKPHDFGDRPLGFDTEYGFTRVPEMAPEIVVPDLAGFELKPYVSYRIPVKESVPFTARDLFDEVYSGKIIDDFNAKQLDESGASLKPSELESMQPDEARDLANRVVSDIMEK